MDSFGMPLDLFDVGESVSFFAVKRLSNPKVWQYHYGLQFPSTARLGGEGRCGDGDDFILAEGTIDMPQRVIDDCDEEGYLYEFAMENVPSIPPEVFDEFDNDQELMQCSDQLDINDSYTNFEELYFDTMGIDLPTQSDYDRASELLAWGNENGWQWDFFGMGVRFEVD